MSPKAPSIEHALVRSTVMLRATNSETAPDDSIGTGFFYKVAESSSGLAKILIVTNKHVIRGAKFVRFVLSAAPSVSRLDAHHQPADRQDKDVTWPLSRNVYEHPDPEIDLCGIDVTLPVGTVMASVGELRVMMLDSTWLTDPEEGSILRDIERVLVVGYPYGFWDDHNNMPIARSGITATHPAALYKGKSNFLVDVAAYQGSSGSPVFAIESPMFRLPNGSMSPGTKVQLLGVVWGVIEQTVEGELKVIEVPSGLKPVPVTRASTNLAIALHGSVIAALDELVFPRKSDATGLAAPASVPSSPTASVDSSADTQAPATNARA